MSVTTRLLFVVEHTPGIRKAAITFIRRNYIVVEKIPFLCKPFTICTTNGFVVDNPGPFYATPNDAQILYTILDYESNGLKALCNLM